MTSYSVIVTAHNNAATLPQALRSVEDAVGHLRAARGPGRDARAEVVVVDDGSSDGTPGLLLALARGKDGYRLVRRPHAGSPSCARNAGAAAASGEFLFFLDADDLFLPPHLAECLAALAGSPAGFAKTGVVLADPVHPDWRPRIEGSVVINLCVRRSLHDAVGGFPDYHLFVRRGDGFSHEADLFYKLEDQFYNGLLAAASAGVYVARPTVEHLRYPGNSFDRQYRKFCQPFGAFREEMPADQRLRLRLCEVIHEHLVGQLRAGRAGPGPPPPPAASGGRAS